MGKPWDKKISSMFCAVSLAALASSCGPVEKEYVPMAELDALDIRLFADFQGRLATGENPAEVLRQNVHWYSAIGDSLGAADNPYILNDSTQIWHKFRALHREGGPAIIYPDKTRDFFFMGERPEKEEEVKKSPRAKRVSKTLSEKKYNDIFLQGRAKDVHTKLTEQLVKESDIRRYAEDQVHYHAGNNPPLSVDEYTWMYNMEKRIQTAHSPMILKDGTKIWHHDRFLSRVVYPDGSEEKFKFGTKISATGPATAENPAGPEGPR